MPDFFEMNSVIPACFKPLFWSAVLATWLNPWAEQPFSCYNYNPISYNLVWTLPTPWPHLEAESAYRSYLFHFKWFLPSLWSFYTESTSLALYIIASSISEILWCRKRFFCKYVPCKFQTLSIKFFFRYLYLENPASFDSTLSHNASTWDLNYMIEL